METVIERPMIQIADLFCVHLSLMRWIVKEYKVKRSIESGSEKDLRSGIELESGHECTGDLTQGYRHRQDSDPQIIVPARKRIRDACALITDVPYKHCSALSSFHSLITVHFIANLWRAALRSVVWGSKRSSSLLLPCPCSFPLSSCSHNRRAGFCSYYDTRPALLSNAAGYRSISFRFTHIYTQAEWKWIWTDRSICAPLRLCNINVAFVRSEWVQEGSRLLEVHFRKQHGPGFLLMLWCCVLLWKCLWHLRWAYYCLSSRFDAVVTWRWKYLESYLNLQHLSGKMLAVIYAASVFAVFN